MATTIYDIAKATSTSHATVSRALNNNPLVNKQTKERIQMVAEKLGYRPNFAATALKTGRTNKLALLVPEVVDPFFAEFVQNVEQNCLSRGYRLTIQSSLGGSSKTSFEEILAGSCDGAIVFVWSYKEVEKIAKQFSTRKMPFIALGTPSKNDRAEVDSIERNIGKGIELAVDHLVELGHKEIVFFDNSPSANEADSNRMEGLKKAFNKHGLKFKRDTVFCFKATDNEQGLTDIKKVAETIRQSASAGSQTKDGYYGIKRLMQICPETTAIIGTSDIVVIGVMRGLFEMGYRVPEDISLVGTDNCWISENLPVGLTSIDIRRKDSARIAVEWFFDRIDNDKWDQPKYVVLDSDLIIRESTAKAKK